MAQNPQQNMTQKMIGSTDPKNKGQTPQNQKGQQAKKGAGITDSTVQKILGDLNNLTRRLRLVEERFTDLRKKVSLVEENSMDEDKELNVQIKANSQDISDIKKNVSGMKDKMNIMVKELQNAAKLTDVQVLEKYISMWEPIEYVTYESVEKTVEHMVDLKMNDLNLKIQEENYIRKEIERQLKKLGHNPKGIDTSTVDDNVNDKDSKEKDVEYKRIKDTDGEDVVGDNPEKIKEDLSSPTNQKNDEKKEAQNKQPKNILKENEEEKTEEKNSDDDLKSITEEINNIFDKKEQAHQETDDNEQENNN